MPPKSLTPLVYGLAVNGSMMEVSNEPDTACDCMAAVWLKAKHRKSQCATRHILAGDVNKLIPQVNALITPRVAKQNNDAPSQISNNTSSDDASQAVVQPTVCPPLKKPAPKRRPPPTARIAKSLEKPADEEVESYANQAQSPENASQPSDSDYFTADVLSAMLDCVLSPTTSTDARAGDGGDNEKDRMAVDNSANLPVTAQDNHAIKTIFDSDLLDQQRSAVVVDPPVPVEQKIVYECDVSTVTMEQHQCTDIYADDDISTLTEEPGSTEQRLAQLEEQVRLLTVMQETLLTHTAAVGTTSGSIAAGSIAHT